MKFGKKLATEAIPEWKSKYINYDTLKRHLKNICPVSQQEVNVIKPDGHSLSSKAAPLAALPVSSPITASALQQAKENVAREEQRPCSVNAFGLISEEQNAAQASAPLAVEEKISDMHDISKPSDMFPCSLDNVNKSMPQGEVHEEDTFEPWNDPRFSLRERLFFEKFEAELEKVNQFYEERESEAIQTKSRLYHQIDILLKKVSASSSEKRRFKDRAKSFSKLSRLLSTASSSAPEKPLGQDRKALYETLSSPASLKEARTKTIFPESLGRPSSTSMIRAPVDRISESASHSAALQDSLMSSLPSSTAHAGKARSHPVTPHAFSKSANDFSGLINTAGLLKGDGGSLSSPTSPLSKIPHSASILFLKSKNAALLEKALLEVYRSLLLLQNYQQLNYLACVKILKKFDKRTERSLKAVVIKKRVDVLDVFSSRVPNDLATDVENVYRIVFAKGDRHEAMEKLRLPDVHKVYHISAFASGLFMGICLALMYYIIFNETKNPGYYLPGLVYFYSLLFLPFLMAWLVGINFAVWELFRVHYQFIFELDARKYLSVPQYLNVIGIVSMCFSFYAFISLHGYLDALLPPYAQPLVLFLLLFSIIAAPFPVFFYSSRRWIFRVLCRVMLFICVYPVRFKDFLLGDLLISLSVVFRLPIIMITYIVHPPSVAAGIPPSMSWIILLSVSFPSFLRLFQCLRRFYDSPRGISFASRPCITICGRSAFPHLFNGVKYLLSALCPLLSGFVLILGYSDVLPAWLVLQGVSTVYSLYWDFVMDWGLARQRKQPFFLREHLIFKHPAVYYFAILSNFVLRWLWLLSAFRVATSFVAVYMLAVAEVFRRFQWNFFRVEHEHLFNCGELRATRVKAFPFLEADLFYQPDVAGLDLSSEMEMPFRASKERDKDGGLCGVDTLTTFAEVSTPSSLGSSYSTLSPMSSSYDALQRPEDADVEQGHSSETTLSRTLSSSYSASSLSSCSGGLSLLTRTKRALQDMEKEGNG